MQGRKGVSEMVSYVLLIVIAVGLSVVVYNYLSIYAPKDKPECKDDVKMILDSYTCKIGSPGNVTLTIVNKGFFNIDAAYIRFGEESRDVKPLINENDLYFTRIITGGNAGLAPGKSAVKSYNLDILTAGKYSVEIQPAVFTETNELALCENAVITQTISCS